ncbi:MAG: hypothetical protein AAF289_22285 [Cyanobacteria bacterium P01_A01_bin.135]
MPAVVGSILAGNLPFGGLTAQEMPNRPASNMPGDRALQVAQADLTPTPSPSDTAPSAFLPGNYLFGEDPRPDQLGMVYAVFSVVGEQVTGAFYMPRSSFDCFRGRVDGDRLALTVRNSYEQTTFPYAIALTRADVAASGEGVGPQTGLAGFHRMATLSDNDRRILSVCQADW